MPSLADAPGNLVVRPPALLRSVWLVHLAVGSCILLEAAAHAGALTIVANPGRFGTIETAAAAEDQVNWWDDAQADDNACTECFAAVELRHFLAACTGKQEGDIRLSEPGQMPADGDVILLGSVGSNPLIESLTPAAAKDFTPPAAEGFHFLSLKRDGRSITVIKGSDHVGALYGAYAYLERVGFRFYGLGERDTVPGSWAKPVELPRTLDLKEQPDYLTRGFWVTDDRGDRPFFLWMARNRLNLWGANPKEDPAFLKKLGMKFLAGGHDTQARCLNPRTYFQAHPEWYGLRNGKRSGHITGTVGDNFCTSNAEARRELAKNLVQECIDGEWRHADLLNVWMLDNGKWCECAACKAQGSYTDRLLSVVHTVSREVTAARKQGRLKRNVQIVTLAYHETLPPPGKPLPADFDYQNCLVTVFPIERCYVHALADPTCTEINDALRRDLQGWTTGAERRYTGSLLIGEYYNVSSFKTLPLLFTHVMAADIPWYYQTGARHFHYMHVPTALWGTWRLNQYLMGRLLWNIHSDAAAILDEYFKRAYPTTEAPMRTFYKELEYATANFKAFKHYIGVHGTRYTMRNRLTNDNAEIFPYDHLHYEPYHPPQNDGPDVVEIVAAMTRARRAMDEALLACADPTERARLLEDERRFAYGEATVEFYYHLVRTALFHHKGDPEQARRELALADRQAAILRGIVDLVQVSGAGANGKNGLDASQAVPVYEYFRRLLSVEN
jgi:hypothetical protein